MQAQDSAVPDTTPAVEFWRDPALPFFEGRRAVGSVSCYTPHTHPTFSIGIVDAGTSVFSLPGRETPIRPGDVVLIAANEVHSCNPAQRESWSYRMFHIDQEWLCALLDEAGMSPRMALVSQVLRSPQACALMNKISDAMRDGEDALQKETVLVDALCELFAAFCTPSSDEMHDAHTGSAQADSDLQPAHDYLQHHCCDKITLDTLAQLAGTGRYQLIRQFRRRYGMTPHALQIDMRINLARDFLRRGASLADIAYRTGFADQSHFHRAFKARVAATPAQYQLGG
ncbi:DNA-binding domain-containing protein, AraC-type [Herbaspirillum sp. CF444]|uniref:AraC family transcriptional regulator n=1 Tax=Herbaspirillum sp. CF444 TaxID=1144319 RepID=UPI0002725D65|nr:AraC family transcriptional regulator [Herbaspirillum sp. CF444]EJL91837.1 DNA-binding domain-containing protein, AraC-type [Herbaspirillum sp. CF444]